MKKIAKYIMIGLLAMHGLATTSCSDWLNLMPSDGVPLDEFWKTKEDVRSVVNGAYLSMTSTALVQRLFLYGEWRADMITSGKRTNSNVESVFNGEISVDNSLLDWASFYETINICNTILKFAPVAKANDPTFSEVQLKEYEGQAIAIRSLMYFYLVRSFGEVPFIREAYVNAGQQMSVPKSSEKEILAEVVADLEMLEADGYLPGQYSSTDIAQNKGRMTIWAVKALLADIYLWQEEYEKCNRKCDEIIGSGQFLLIPVEREERTVVNEEDGTTSVYNAPDQSSYYSLFRQIYYEGNSMESIFELQFSTENLNPFYAMMRSSSGYIGVKTERVNVDIFTPLEDETYSGECFDIRSMICQGKSSLWKYIGVEPNGAERASEEYTNNFIIYRLAEIYLMKAEALTQLAILDDEDQELLKEAYAMVKVIRDRSTAVPTTDISESEGAYTGKTMEEFVLAERGREMIFEGRRWFDVLRQAKRNNYADNNLEYLMTLAEYSAPASKVNSLKVKYSNYNSHYLPIYSEELDVNPLLQQNEFYANN